MSSADPSDPAKPSANSTDATQSRCEPGQPSADVGQPSAEAAESSPPTPQDLKSALKAFRKRWKVTLLDDQSRLGVGPMSSGRRSGIVGIMPPEQFPRAVGRSCARQGKLKKVGSGQYGLVEP